MTVSAAAKLIAQVGHEGLSFVEVLVPLAGLRAAECDERDRQAQRTQSTEGGAGTTPRAGIPKSHHLRSFPCMLSTVGCSTKVSKAFADALPPERDQERARYTDEIFFATSTSRSVTFPPRS